LSKKEKRGKIIYNVEKADDIGVDSGEIEKDLYAATAAGG